MSHHNLCNEFVVSRCWDAAFVDHVFAQLLPNITTDQCPGVLPGKLLLALPDAMFVQVGEEGRAPEGLGALYGNEVHTLFLPSLRGSRAVRAARAAINWVWKNTQFDALRSYVFSNRPEVALFARLMGFEFYGAPEEGATIGGVPVTKYCLALKRPCPPQSQP